MYCGGKAEEICFYGFYYYNIILTTSTLSLVIVGAILEMLFCFPL